MSNVAELPKVKKNKRGHMKGRQVDGQALAEVQALLGDDPRQRDLLIEYLHRIQDTYQHISAEHMVALAHEMKLAMTEVYEVATFYHHFDVIKDDDTPPPALTVRVCESVTCEMYGCDSLVDDLQKQHGSDVRIQRVPCVGRCYEAPVAVVGRNQIGHATKDNVKTAVDAGAIMPPEVDGVIHYDGYRADGGYQTLAACVNGERDVEEVVTTLEDAKLRGLGGAGFPAGRKWRALRQEPEPRYVAINIDEGEPGTFKDRYYLERDPHRFLEGTLIGAWAVNAPDVYLYLRDEYAAAERILHKTVADLEANPPCKLPRIHIRRGAGAYICGEESAMIESIEGKRGMPRLRPPLVAQVGIFGQPTLEQNLETMHWVRDVLEKGPEWFASQGRNGRQGMRSFSVSGRVKKPGVHLAPAGITLRELIDEYCDGMEDGHELYGYFPGGASGGILPASKADVPLDFDTLQDVDKSCFIGSAAIIVLSDKDSARQTALNAMRFFSHESCGQCTPCRVGTAKAVKLMEKDHWDTPLLEELATAMVDASICGLGQAAPNPLRCAIKYFPEEFK
ncbi:formate dehydrogenase [Methylohalomonas lacus]|uniref:NADH-quinone oxidoreductase subunit F n=2 Tax=Methylohalomonas lacus TaxID=398773 RepID=A0AAE3HN43_9GAMM|nr:formate dehydrogenase [Methylohalomonas lacus]